MTYKQPSAVKPPRIAPLSVLPVFFNLAGKAVLVAGGSDAAAWKAELLHAAGAQVHVYAPDLCESLAQLRAAGEVTHDQEHWSAASFSDFALAIGDVEDADAFYAAALSAGVPVNVIDQPKYCSFQFGSIVNRSPVVVGISTSGAAPVLGQTIRQKIEAILPRTLGRWAKAAKQGRAWLLRQVPDAQTRRGVWQRFANKALHDTEIYDVEDAFKALTKTPALHTKGKVTLVGAGPGDADLLTLKAVRALQSADVILFDDLISQDVLDLARREAKRMLVGKRGGRVSCRQDDINALMLKLVRQGKHVVRLKSGDAMIFGRAGEEITALEAAGIPVAVVPGVTSALAAAAAAKVSLTHRDHAQSVRFITGHSRNGALPRNFDWDGLADPQTTMMIYMGGSTIAAFCAKLLEKGYDQATPAIIFQDVSRANQSMTGFSVGALARGAWQKDDRPVLIGIGAALKSAALENERLDGAPVEMPEHALA